MDHRKRSDRKDKIFQSFEEFQTNLKKVSNKVLSHFGNSQKSNFLNKTKEISMNPPNKYGKNSLTSNIFTSKILKMPYSKQWLTLSTKQSYPYPTNQMLDQKHFGKSLYDIFHSYYELNIIPTEKMVIVKLQDHFDFDILQYRHAVQDYIEFCKGFIQVYFPKDSKSKRKKLIKYKN